MVLVYNCCIIIILIFEIDSPVNFLFMCPRVDIKLSPFRNVKYITMK
jgi:lipopolysaccharide/colanic/teichoic acid biosynthesis glycosyltransferase